jgi:Domain of unknown function (DUF4384)
MISALLLPMFLAGTPIDRVAPPNADEPAVQLWINNDRRFLPGDRAKVQVRARDDGYLLVLHVDPDGYLRVLFPLDPKDDNFVRGGHKYEIRGRAGRESFSADSRYGQGTVYAAVSRDPFHFDQVVLGDHWDYRALAPNRLPRDPESDLNDLVRRLASGSFDYDMLSYDVIERVVYADDYSTPYYGSAYYGGCGGYYFSCGRPYYRSPYSLSIGLFFGRPYRRFYYDPFYAAYDPFYDPFFYDPFYYRPVYTYPLRPFYPYPYRYSGIYYQRFPGYNRPYTPYRFRPTDGVVAGYRDRRFDLRRSVNTVYLPPTTTRVREPITSSPVRRVAQRTVADQPTGTAVRETARRPEPNIERRRMDRPVEARRAREPEQPRNSGSDARSRRSDMPVEIRPPSRDVQPQIERAPIRAQDNPEPDAQPARREEETRVWIPRSSDRGANRAEVDRGDRASGDRASSDRPFGGRDQDVYERGDDRGASDRGASDRGGGNSGGGDRGGGERRGDDHGGARAGGGDRGSSPPAPSSGGGGRGGGRRR